MKKLTNIIFVVSILTILFPLTRVASAIEYERYTTEAVSEQEKIDFLKPLNFRKSETEFKDYPISCFAISEDGLIALGFNAGEEAKINIYNLEGRFLYGYRFTNNGSTLVTFFEGEALSLFWGKRNYIASFDSEGNCIQLRKAINTNQTADAYDSDRWRPAKGTVGNMKYYAEGNGLSNKFSRFTVEDSSGKRIVIYDATEEISSRNVVTCVALISVAALILFTIYKNKPEKYSQQ